MKNFDDYILDLEEQRNVIGGLSKAINNHNELTRKNGAVVDFAFVEADDRDDRDEFGSIKVNDRDLFDGKTKGDRKTWKRDRFGSKREM